jgi:hypothetical protein
VRDGGSGPASQPCRRWRWWQAATGGRLRCGERRRLPCEASKLQITPVDVPKQLNSSARHTPTISKPINYCLFSTLRIIGFPNCGRFALLLSFRNGAESRLQCRHAVCHVNPSLAGLVTGHTPLSYSTPPSIWLGIHRNVISVPAVHTGRQEHCRSRISRRRVQLLTQGLSRLLPSYPDR